MSKVLEKIALREKNKFNINILEKNKKETKYLIYFMKKYR